jgi:asparagine synthetase B (glutamine-hydrolysing)
MKTARENKITVLLDGQGGDETLLGYERYYSAYLMAVYKKKGFNYVLRAARNSAKNNALMRPLKVIQYFLYFSSARLRYFNYKKRNNFLKNIPPFPGGVRFENNKTNDIYLTHMKGLNANFKKEFHTKNIDPKPPETIPAIAEFLVIFVE